MCLKFRCRGLPVPAVKGKGEPPGLLTLCRVAHVPIAFKGSFCFRYDSFVLTDNAHPFCSIPLLLFLFFFIHCHWRACTPNTPVSTLRGDPTNNHTFINAKAKKKKKKKNKVWSGLAYLFSPFAEFHRLMGFFYLFIYFQWVLWTRRSFFKHPFTCPLFRRFVSTFISPLQLFFSFLFFFCFVGDLVSFLSFFPSVFSCCCVVLTTTTVT